MRRTVHSKPFFLYLRALQTEEEEDDDDERERIDGFNYLIFNGKQQSVRTEK